MQENYVVSVDVGTGSVRAALISTKGEHITMATHHIKTWNHKLGYFHQSSENIWESCCQVIKEVVKRVPPDSVKGLGFDATCSLVVLDKSNHPLTISPNGESDQNVILWMDHRAEKEAEAVNKTGHAVLKSVGGKISLEMQVPKLMWLKTHLPQTWEKAGVFYDLPDFLTWKATGADSRSLCSLVCKWTYEAGHDGIKGWNSDFFGQVGLSDLLENGCCKIGSVVLAPGTPCGSGLQPEVARLLGLTAGTPVATSIIDAHAGGLGLLGCSVLRVDTDFSSRLAVICGTSTCLMAVSPEPVCVPGVWGPYLSAMVPGLWLSEGGQSATGKLLDHIIKTHPAASLLQERNPETPIVVQLTEILKKLSVQTGLDSVDLLTSHIHVWPDFHGNRSPLADPTLRGMISGLSLSADERDLAVLYLATLQSLAYGTRFIVEALEASGHSRLSHLLVCGGLTKHPLYVQTQASVVGRPVLVPHRTEAVLGGTAMLAACAAGVYSSVPQAVTAMAGPANIVKPDDKVLSYHDKKYKVFQRMVKDQQAYRDIMSLSPTP